MIDIRFSESANNGILSLKIKGHAGQAPIGQDIVCASVSILAYTVAQTLLFMYEEGRLHEEPVVDMESGDVLIVCRPKDDYYGEALHTFFVAKVGCTLLAQNYPQYVDVKMFGQADSALI